ncbi:MULTISPECIES: holo-ACP synthase [Saccharibacillus]|jgi:holo-[acyl-carrier protein] synthase|uniref:Holo-[acyl-carrier-protein] synthase n=1 Tax=Saccharibacillus brassicae TaxID=2583377 RepID=A0A4Y6UZ89_SACBS|nr:MULTISPECIES: holo-ACP synthase [Saccharibacillus]MWJ29563.1 holo-[acyl-carrier-protein] synthase [Saccharibacillus sp. WB 17]QDH21848.1 holo-[acyl-carrier-protein] synthase [Saccharibacillus brassicae]
MIHGIGHDILEIGRVIRLLDGAQRERFLHRVLTPAELEIARARGPKLAEFVSGRFAAKEAIVKALGCGIGRIVGFEDIEIVPGALGKPGVRLSDAAWSRLGLPGGNGYAIHLSITHQPAMASAFAVVERTT